MDTKKNEECPSSEQIEVHGTEDGKLYIIASELFALESVQELIRRAVSSKALKDVNKVTPEIGQPSI